jgi:hypothetical protein
MIAIGTRKLRYPGNDPENGPAEWHTWDGTKWVEPEPPHVDWRRLKREERQSHNALDAAELRGAFDAYDGKRYHNIYPPGRRHDAYKHHYYMNVGKRTSFPTSEDETK